MNKTEAATYPRRGAASDEGTSRRNDWTLSPRRATESLSWHVASLLFYAGTQNSLKLKLIKKKKKLKNAAAAHFERLHP